MKPITPINEKRAQLGGGTLSLTGNEPFGSSFGFLNNTTNTPQYSSTNFIQTPKDTKKVNRSLLVDTTVKVSDFRKQRYELLKVIKRILASMDFRVADCMKALGNTSIVREHNGRVHSTNLMLCGSIWLCPICSSRITEQRREELDRAVKNNPGLLPVLVTFTLQHNRTDTLKKLLDRLNTALQKLKTGYSWLQFQRKHGVKAYASSLEITYSIENGWHPHKHLLFFVEQGTDLIEFEKDITAKYLALLDKLGGYGSEFHAVDCRSGTAEAGSYISKWGITTEFTKANLKKGRGDSFSIWEVALLAEQDSTLWTKYREYAEATYRRKAITWSKGARKLLGIGDELTDEQVALQETETEPEAETIATLSPKLWNRIVLDALQEEVYTAVDAGGLELLWEFIRAQDYPVVRRDNFLLWTS